MTALERIRARLAEKRESYANLEAYRSIRAREDDLHGGWDSSIEMYACQTAINELEFAEKAIEEERANRNGDGSLKQCDQRSVYGRCGMAAGHKEDHYDGKTTWKNFGELDLPLCGATHLTARHGLVACNLLQGHSADHEAARKTETFRWDR